MHGILAIAAQHKAHLLPLHRETYVTLAAYHQAHGLEGFMPHLNNVSEENWESLFCFGSLVIMYASLLPARSESGRLPAPISDILELFSYVKGIQAVFEPFFDYLRRSLLAPLIHGVWIADPGKWTRTPTPTSERITQTLYGTSSTSQGSSPTRAFT
ncbi:hypothetical protein SAPIO_CDS4775 [Scedosporium apiospermum]|uniref:Uncharacterized protein n=1 Tax=Pseudallescheria apiosperma TaxID=563466 RepID=A0A084G7L5_PSEDA|nr:uncharacterized protein SAPIO_CDS4775 [Scedosporium apiospermum]KEZ43327.1 hypothetical protein SAPIO_CDS4775 [Scedosporium apiospermum]